MNPSRIAAYAGAGLLAFVVLPARFAAQTESRPEGAGLGVVALYDKTWGVEVNLPGFSIRFNGMKTGSQRYFVAKNDETGVIVSMTLEEMAPGNSEGLTCREMMNAHVASDEPANGPGEFAGADKKNVKIWEAGDKTYLEYRIVSLRALGSKPVPINQENKFACFVHDRSYIDMHVSKAGFEAEDDKRFNAIFDSLKIHEGLARTSLDYFLAGTAYYNAHDIKRAIPPYAQALVMERQERKLEQNRWCVLVDNLGMAYGATGDLETARKTFEYGIENAPDYPMFYYELADYYGEKNDLQNAMSYLQKAYDRRERMLPGEKFPDARSDDSFKKLMKNREFQEFVKTVDMPTLMRRPKYQ